MSGGRAPAAAILSWLVALGGCRGEPDEVAPAPRRIQEPTAEPAWAPDVRRPPWRFALEKTGSGCVVLRIDGGERLTRGEPAPCPVDLREGERLRLAGSVCLREGGDPARSMPVVCPDPLTNAEKDFLEAERAAGRLPAPAASP